MKSLSHLAETATSYREQDTLDRLALTDLGLAANCLSAAAAAVFLGLDPNHSRRIQQLGKRGQLPRLRVGRTYVYPVSGLLEYTRKRTERNSPRNESQA